MLLDLYRSLYFSSVLRLNEICYLDHGLKIASLHQGRGFK